MAGLGFKGLLLLLAIVLFIVGALSDDQQDLLFWGLAVFAAAFVVESLPLGNLGPRRTNDR